MINRRSEGTGTVYYQYPDDKKLVRKEWLFSSFIIQDTLPGIAWHVSSDTATLGDLHCQKATTHFKGRDYTAWFCPDLPIHAGPWKLNGLPGVIVEAYDAKKEVVFKFDGIEKATLTADTDGSRTAMAQGPSGGPMGGDEDGDPAIILPPARGIKTNEKEFAKMKEAEHKDPTAFAQSMLDAQHANNVAAGMRDPGPNKISVKEMPGPVENNPIELPENGSK